MSNGPRKAFFDDEILFLVLVLVKDQRKCWMVLVAPKQEHLGILSEIIIYCLFCIFIGVLVVFMVLIFVVFGDSVCVDNEEITNDRFFFFLWLLVCLVFRLNMLSGKRRRWQLMILLRYTVNLSPHACPWSNHKSIWTITFFLAHFTLFTFSHII